jgi:hypothetical protein
MGAGACGRLLQLQQHVDQRPDGGCRRGAVPPRRLLRLPACMSDSNILKAPHSTAQGALPAALHDNIHILRALSHLHSKWYLNVVSTESLALVTDAYAAASKLRQRITECSTTNAAITTNTL